MRARAHLVLCTGALAFAAAAQTPGTQASTPIVRQQEAPAPATQPLPPSRWTPAQIREAFLRADLNSDGQLSRAEAQRLAMLPRSFEDLDTNKDGALVLAEYEASFTP